jgi:hypothetical protein
VRFSGSDLQSLGGNKIMKIIKKILLLALLSALSQAVGAGYKFEPGDTVLTNCRQIYSKGQVKAQVDDGYTVHFPKSSGPINCPPFRWHAEFVQPFESVPEYRLKFFGGLKGDMLFRKGETVVLRLETDRRVVKNAATVDMEAEITDISSIGAVALKLLSQNPDAAATFWQLIGNNYIDLRHKALAPERDKRAR